MDPNLYILEGKPLKVNIPDLFPLHEKALKSQTKK